MIHPNLRYPSTVCDSAIAWGSWDGVNEAQVDHQLVYRSVSGRMDCGIVKFLGGLIPISKLLTEGLNCPLKPLKLVLSFVKLFFDLRNLCRSESYSKIPCW